MTILLQTLDKPHYGYWDGGAKSRFRWTVDSYGNDHGVATARVGSWEANLYFTVARGRTERLTLANAKRHLKAITRIPCTFEYKETTP